MNTTINLTDSIDPEIQTYGGEFPGETYLNDYGIQIDDLNITGIQSGILKKLAVEMVNHLIANGHEFEMIQSDHQDVRMVFKEKKKL